VNLKSSGIFYPIMGKIINLDNLEGDPPDVLTGTGPGGLLSAGYLHDEPALAAVDDDETPQFVLTSRKHGIEIGGSESGETVRPGRNYRMIGVVTDKRLLLLVGENSGDTRFAIPHVDIDQIAGDRSLGHGRIAFRRCDDTEWQVHCGKQGLVDLTAYLSHASQAWVRVENILDEVKRLLVTASEQRDRGDHDKALATVREAEERLDTAGETATEFGSPGDANALEGRVTTVRERYVEMLAEIRRSRARRAGDTGEQHWRRNEFEAAYDAYDAARAEYQEIFSLPTEAVPKLDEIRAERDRLDSVVEDLERSPLRIAVEADNEAVAAEDPAVAADHWDEALEAYRDVLELDWGADERRFAGDPEKVRDRLGTVAENLVAARRTVATDAMEAGDWYADASQPDAALEEYEAAQAAFEAALAAARDCYPDATDHLEAELDAVEQRLSRTETRLDGEPVDVDDRFDETGTTPELDFTAADKRSPSPADTTELADIEGTEPKIDLTGHDGS
jgi:tetratricopeptide (TPR) repeat protein